MVTWTSDYHYPQFALLHGGGFGSVAVKTTIPMQAYYRYTKDGSTWAAAAVYIGTMTHACGIVQYDSGRLVVTDGFSAAYYSDDYGKTWSAL